eukprot:scaffold421280_cov72-Attheya_sp.AAC.2
MVANFALTPAMAHVGILDYEQGEGHNIYFASIYQLSKETFYDCMPGGLNGFLKTLGNRAQSTGWNENGIGILMIPEDPIDPNMIYYNLLSEYGQITLDQV